jgi:hypothetical protein
MNERKLLMMLEARMAEVEEKIAKLQRERDLLRQLVDTSEPERSWEMSEEGKKNISAGQRRRWERWRKRLLKGEEAA